MTWSLPPRKALSGYRSRTAGAFCTLMMALSVACVGSVTSGGSGEESRVVSAGDVQIDGRSAAVQMPNGAAVRAGRDAVPQGAVTLAKGEGPDGRSFRAFVFPRDGRRGLGLKYHGDVETRCCVGRMRGALRPVGFLVGTVVAFASSHVRHAKYFPYQLAPHGKVRGHVYTSRHTDLVARLVFVFHDLSGMDGDLVAYDEDHVQIARRYVGLPPACAHPRSRSCFA